MNEDTSSSSIDSNTLLYFEDLPDFQKLKLLQFLVLFQSLNRESKFELNENEILYKYDILKTIQNLQ